MSELMVNDLTFQPKRSKKEILKQISETFVEGEFYGILGPNGSGKTTLIRHLLGLLKVQSGDITLENRQLEGYRKKELATKISFVPQNTFIDAEFTVYDIVAMGRTPYHSNFKGLSIAEEKLIYEAMDITNTSAYKDKFMNQLSGGEAQRVLVARAIAQDTPWMILDEPISHLDIKHQIELMETLRRLNQTKKKTIIAILHDINLTSAYCSRVVLLRNGRIYDSGKTTEVLTAANLSEVYGIDFSVQQEEGTTRLHYFPIVSQ